MSDQFQPFAKSAGQVRTLDQPLTLTVIPGGGKHTAAPSSSLASGASPSAPADPVGAAGPEPQVSLEREGDRISRIVVRCACGRTLELVCSY